MNDKHYCQVPGCHRHAAKVVEIDLPAAWEATAAFTTVSLVAGCCHTHGHEIERRVQAMLQARTEFHDLLTIIEQAVRYEKALQLRLEAATA
jgi:hypothetical protein